MAIIKVNSVYSDGVIYFYLSLILHVNARICHMNKQDVLLTLKGILCNVFGLIYQLLSHFDD